MNKPIGAILSSYSRIGGVLRHTPVRVQTDGSYRPQLSRIAMMLFNHDGEYMAKDMYPIRANSSTETEWASVAAGLEFALEHGQTTIAIENDNLVVISSLIEPSKPLRHEYAHYYRNEIQRLAAYTAWTGVRWIPREINYADRLFT